MRVGTPLCTSSTITDCGPSATSAVNSSPRMIGPGCITIASRLASFKRALRHLVARNVVLQRIFCPARRSFCTRSSMTTSVPRRASSMWRVTRKPGSERSGNVGHELRRTAQRDLHSKLGQQMAGAARDAAVKNVADESSPAVP